MQVTPWFRVEGRLDLARACLLLGDVAPAQRLLAEARLRAATASDLGILDDLLEELEARVDALAVWADGGAAELTAAELRVLQFLPTHLTFAEIGDRLHLSRNTVKTQAVSTYRKLDASSRGEAIERAHELGLFAG